MPLLTYRKKRPATLPPPALHASRALLPACKHPTYAAFPIWGLSYHGGFVNLQTGRTAPIPVNPIRMRS